MRISSVTQTQHYLASFGDVLSRGIPLSGVKAARRAIIALGEMLSESPEHVAVLADRMVAEMTKAHERVGELVCAGASVSLSAGGYASASHQGHFFWHNGPMGAKAPPFRNLVLNVHCEDDCNGVILIVTDVANQEGGPSHTESQLAILLGRYRPLHDVKIVCEIGRDGKNVRFDLAAIARALYEVDSASLDGRDDLGVLAAMFLESKRVGLVGYVDSPCRGMRVRWGLGGWSNPRGEARYHHNELIASPDEKVSPNLWLIIFGNAITSDADMLQLAEDLTNALYVSML